MAKEADKFNLAEACSNESGKTSGSKFIGVYWGIIVGLTVLAGILAYFIVPKHPMDLLTWAAAFAALVLTLLSISKGLEKGVNKDDNQK